MDAADLPRTCRERPRSRPTEQRDELAPLHRCDHSITSSAWASNVGETDRPSDFAVFILMTNWNFVGCSTGKLAGWVPLMILWTNSAVRSYSNTKLAEMESRPQTEVVSRLHGIRL